MSNNQHPTLNNRKLQGFFHFTTHILTSFNNILTTGSNCCTFILEFTLKISIRDLSNFLALIPLKVFSHFIINHILFIKILKKMKSPKSSNSIFEKEKEIFKVEIKKVVDVIIEGSEKADFDMAIAPYLVSPDFVYILQGNILSYEDSVKLIKPVFEQLSNQAFTTKSEKISFIDRATVLYTADLTCRMNFKNGSSLLLDPCAMFMLFRKIDNDWKVAYAVESYVEKAIEK